ncbi:MAG: hypothetical protein AB3N17_02345 [Tateyamaria sp.]
MKRLILALCLAVPTSVSAGQPVSESLVQCAQLFDTSNRLHPSYRTSGNGQKLAALAERFMDAAAREAKREGQSSVRPYLRSHASQKAAYWDAKGEGYLFTDNFQEWARYCRTLGQNRGVYRKISVDYLPRTAAAFR